VRKVLAPIEARLLLSPEQGAQTTLHCATAAGLVGGGYFVNCTERKPCDEAQNAAVAERLWNETWAAVANKE
jgi:hypothetical protein